MFYTRNCHDVNRTEYLKTHKWSLRVLSVHFKVRLKANFTIVAHLQLWFGFTLHTSSLIRTADKRLNGYKTEYAQVRLLYLLVGNTQRLALSPHSKTASNLRTFYVEFVPALVSSECSGFLQ